MPQALSDWQAAFFMERVQTPTSGDDGAYFREQVFGALEVLSGSLPELEAALGEQNFRYFVRELLAETQPRDAMGNSLVIPFLELLLERPELRDAEAVRGLASRRRADFASR